MEIESLRLDFQPIHIKEKPTQNISEKNPEKEEEEKKNRTKREEPRSEKREKESGESSQLTSPAWPGLVWPGVGVAWARAQKQVACDLGRRRAQARDRRPMPLFILFFSFFPFSYASPCFMAPLTL